jgi:hypothetical protein
MEVISKKMADQGVKLSKKQTELIVNNLTENIPINFKFQRWKFWDQRHIHLELAKEDLAEIEKRASSITARSKEIIWSLIEEVSPVFLSKLKGRYRKISRKESKVKKSFETHLFTLWKELIDLLSRTLGLSKEFGEKINTRLRKQVKDATKYSVEILTRLQARGCQVTSEIITLLSTGYADGAMARWRTLHEIAVTASFLHKCGESAAERYYFHQAVETYRAAMQYEKYRDRLGYEAIPPNEISEKEEAYKKVVARYGKDYSHKYGWASSFLDKSNPNFADIEESVDVEYIRPYYKMASYNVHATSRGAFFRLGLMPEIQLLLTGPTDFGLADPGRYSALTLALIDSTLVTLDPTFDLLVELKVLSTISREAAESFWNIQAEAQWAVA